LSHKILHFYTLIDFLSQIFDFFVPKIYFFPSLDRVVKFLCFADESTIGMRPSTMGGGAIIAAIERLNGPQEMQKAVRQVSHLLHQQPNEVTRLVGLFTARASHTDKLATCTTPTDVHDVRLDD